MTPFATTDPAPGKSIMLYDGMCRLCLAGVRNLKRLDWLKRLHYQDCRDIDRLPPSAVPLDPQRLLEEMHVVTPDRQRVHAGYAAFRFMAWRLPLTWPIAPLMYVPGIPWLGSKLYLWIARNRYDLVPCKDGACQLHSPKR
jgi:predicted DCC family thiol-disulfide oxidoreductase YuxK